MDRQVRRALQPFHGTRSTLCLLRTGFHSWLCRTHNFVFSRLAFCERKLRVPGISNDGSGLEHIQRFVAETYNSAPYPHTRFANRFSFVNHCRPYSNNSRSELLSSAQYAFIRPRYEVIVEGTDDSAITPSTRWREYEFIGKPGDVHHTPPQVAPYHLRLDWLMWFLPFRATVTPEGVAMPYGEEPWFISFMGKLLKGDKPVLGLLRYNPFPDAPPKFVRALLYEYHFATPEDHTTA